MPDLRQKKEVKFEEHVVKPIIIENKRKGWHNKGQICGLEI